MTEAELAELLQGCPTLFHMAAGGSWPSIQRHGLRSTASLLELFAVPEGQRSTLLRVRRPEGVALRHPVHGTAVVRDQKPMTDAALRRCLQDGLTPAAWLELLNGRVFFWLSRARLLTLLGGREYRDATHDVLEVDAAALVAAYRGRTTLSPINSGATFALGPAPRGLRTFQPIDRYDYAARRKRHPVERCAVELTVDGAVPDIARFVRRVVRMRGEVEGEVLFRPGRRPAAGQSSPWAISS